jgi:hypothetical protein
MGCLVLLLSLWICGRRLGQRISFLFSGGASIACSRASRISGARKKSL